MYVCILLFPLTFRMRWCIRPQSCPPLRSFSSASDKLEEQLDTALSVFCNRGVKVDSDGRNLVINSIFKWFRVDFASNEAKALRSVTIIDLLLTFFLLYTCQKSVHLSVSVVQVQAEVYTTAFLHHVAVHSCTTFLTPSLRWLSECVNDVSLRQKLLEASQGRLSVTYDYDWTLNSVSSGSSRSSKIQLTTTTVTSLCLTLLLLLASSP